MARKMGGLKTQIFGSCVADHNVGDPMKWEINFKDQFGPTFGSKTLARQVKMTSCVDPTLIGSGILACGRAAEPGEG